jgi:hypothetical protein
MKSPKSLFVLIAAIGLFVSLQSCANKNEAQVSSKADATVVKSSESPKSIDSTESPKSTDNSKSIKTSNQTSEPSPSSLANFDAKKSERLTDSAKFLAGMKVNDTQAIAQLTKSSSWKQHAASFDKAWGNLEAQQLSKVRKWAGEELKPINQTSKTLFYPFSGPDFLYAYSFFPNASDYVLVGLEPVGKVPDLDKLSESQVKTKLREVNGSMDAILGFSFFRTNAMKVDLEKQGVLPILYVFMARTNNRILDVQYIGLDKDANIRNLDKNNPDKTLVSGVKISFLQEGKSQPQTLYYFSTDLSNSGLQKTPGFNKFVKKFDTPVTYLKAASYLMYNESFSSMRNLILAQSDSLLQDDSGIPVKYFDQKKWDLAFYGTYTKPIDLFSKRYQPDLRKIYTSDKKIEPLNFGIGYKYRLNQSNLMLAIGEGKSKSQP